MDSAGPVTRSRSKVVRPTGSTPLGDATNRTPATVPRRSEKQSDGTREQTVKQSLLGDFDIAAEENVLQQESDQMSSQKARRNLENASYSPLQASPEGVIAGGQVPSPVQQAVTASPPSTNDRATGSTWQDLLFSSPVPVQPVAVPTPGVLPAAESSFEDSLSPLPGTSAYMYDGAMCGDITFPAPTPPPFSPEIPSPPPTMGLSTYPDDSPAFTGQSLVAFAGASIDTPSPCVPELANSPLEHTIISPTAWEVVPPTDDCTLGGSPMTFSSAGLQTPAIGGAAQMVGAVSQGFAFTPGAAETSAIVTASPQVAAGTIVGLSPVVATPAGNDNLCPPHPNFHAILGLSPVVPDENTPEGAAFRAALTAVASSVTTPPGTEASIGQVISSAVVSVSPVPIAALSPCIDQSSPVALPPSAEQQAAAHAWASFLPMYHSPMPQPHHQPPAFVPVLETVGAGTPESGIKPTNMGNLLGDLADSATKASPVPDSNSGDSPAPASEEVNMEYLEGERAGEYDAVNDGVPEVPEEHNELPLHAAPVQQTPKSASPAAMQADGTPASSASRATRARMAAGATTRSGTRGTGGKGLKATLVTPAGAAVPTNGTPGHRPMVSEAASPGHTPWPSVPKPATAANSEKKAPAWAPFLGAYHSPMPRTVPSYAAGTKSSAAKARSPATVTSPDTGSVDGSAVVGFMDGTEAVMGATPADEAQALYERVSPSKSPDLTPAVRSASKSLTKSAPKGSAGRNPSTYKPPCAPPTSAPADPAMWPDVPQLASPGHTPWAVLPRSRSKVDAAAAAVLPPPAATGCVAAVNSNKIVFKVPASRSVAGMALPRRSPATTPVAQSTAPTGKAACTPPSSGGASGSKVAPVTPQALEVASPLPPVPAIQDAAVAVEAQEIALPMDAPPLARLQSSGPAEQEMNEEATADNAVVADVPRTDQSAVPGTALAQLLAPYDDCQLPHGSLHSDADQAVDVSLEKTSADVSMDDVMVEMSGLQLGNVIDGPMGAPSDATTTKPASKKAGTVRMRASIFAPTSSSLAKAVARKGATAAPTVPRASSKPQRDLPRGKYDAADAALKKLHDTHVAAVGRAPAAAAGPVPCNVAKVKRGPVAKSTEVPKIKVKPAVAQPQEDSLRQIKKKINQKVAEHQAWRKTIAPQPKPKVPSPEGQGSGLALGSDNTMDDSAFSADCVDDVESKLDQDAEDALVQGMSRMRVSQDLLRGIPAATGKHIRFGDDGEPMLSPSAGKVMLRGVPTARGAHLHFDDE